MPEPSSFADLYFPPPESPARDAFGPRATPLGDPEAIEPVAYGYRNHPGRGPGILKLLRAFLTDAQGRGRPAPGPPPGMPPTRVARSFQGEQTREG